MNIGKAGSGHFIMHTFMAEETEITNYIYTTELLESTEFRGQGGNLTSATFNRINDVSGSLFTGSATHNPKYVDEDVIY